MSVRFVACVTRYSRGAKIRVVGNTIQVLLQFFSGVSLPKIIRIGIASTELLEN